MPIFAANSVNLVTGWQTLWTAINNALGPLAALLTAVGAALIVVAILGWIWERRRGGGGAGHQKLFWTLIIGAVLASPDLLIPFFLTIADFIINAIANLAAGHTSGVIQSIK